MGDHKETGLTGPSSKEDDTAKCCCCRRSTFRLCTFMCFFVAYLCLGAGCFMWLEISTENVERKKLISSRSLFLTENACVAEDSLNDLVSTVIEASNKGVTMKNNITSESNWSYGQSIFFAMTIVTTIGYGRTTPLSEPGKAFCIIYALFGIPLTMVMFTAMVERVYEPARKILEWMQTKLLGKCTGFDLRFIHFSMAVTFLSALLIFLPSGIFAIIEKDWSYLDALYYCFISLTTVGLGDFIPGESTELKYREPYKICVTFYLFLGLIGMLFVLRLFKDVPELNIGLQIYTSSDDVSDEKKKLHSNKDLPQNYTEESTTTIDSN